MRYLADSAEHAIGEALGPFRGTDFHPAYLRRAGWPLALVPVRLAASLLARIADCTDPHVLAHYALRPDALAHHDRTITQAIARKRHDLGASGGEPSGLRWWSSLTGGWHTTVIFTGMEHEEEIVFGVPHVLEASDSLLVHALDLLGIRMR